MDLITSAIVTALVSGVTSGMSEASKKMILDGYKSIKTVLKKKCGIESEVINNMEKLEENPNSKETKEKVEESLEAEELKNDEELRKLARGLLEKINATSEGKSIIKKYNIDVDKIGILGDNTNIQGDMNF